MRLDILNNKKFGDGSDILKKVIVTQEGVRLNFENGVQTYYAFASLNNDTEIIIQNNIKG